MVLGDGNATLAVTAVPVFACAFCCYWKALTYWTCSCITASMLSIDSYLAWIYPNL